MSLCTQLRDWIWDTEWGSLLVETGLQLQAGTGSFPSSSSCFIEKLCYLTEFFVWGHGKQERITILHCTCRAFRAPSWSGISTSAGDQAWRSAWYEGGRASGGRLRYRECVETRWILGEHGATRGRHRLPWCWHHWSFDTGCYPAMCVACQDGNTLQVLSLGTRTKKRHVARDDVGRYIQGNLQVILLTSVCNAWRCHLQSERFNTSSRR